MTGAALEFASAPHKKRAGGNRPGGNRPGGIVLSRRRRAAEASVAGVAEHVGCARRDAVRAPPVRRSEREQLIEKTDTARAKVEAMIQRLRTLEKDS